MITAHFFYDDNDSGSWTEFAEALTALQAERPNTLLAFCTHPEENAIGVLTYSADDSLTPAALEQAWNAQAVREWADATPEVDIPAWAAQWQMLHSDLAPEPALSPPG